MKPPTAAAPATAARCCVRLLGALLRPREPCWAVVQHLHDKKPAGNKYVTGPFAALRGKQQVNAAAGSGCSRAGMCQACCAARPWWHLLEW